MLLNFSDYAGGVGSFLWYLICVIHMNNTIGSVASNIFHFLRIHVNSLVFAQKLHSYRRLHLGCGDIHLDGYLNVDSRPTKAVDMIGDCSDISFLPARQYSEIYSNAFFEHLYREERLPCLRSIYTRLSSNGVVVFTGIPDFSCVARAYLEKKQGITTKIFDINQAYRYTHGEPEGKKAWWLAQLHKSLFDTQTTKHLLKDAGFSRFCIFTYIYGKDKTRIAQGFMAWKNKEKTMDKQKLIEYLYSFPSNIQKGSIRIEFSTVS